MVRNVSIYKIKFDMNWIFMSDNRRKDAKNMIIAIKNSDDPYDILRLSFLLDSEYSPSIRDTACKAMVDMLFQNDTPNNVMGIRVIHAVLNMMRMSDDPARSQLGCNILWNIDIKTPYSKLAPISFILMMEHIDSVVTETLRKHRLACHDCPWLRHAESVLRNTANIRLHYSKIDRSTNETSRRLTDWTSNFIRLLSD